MSLSFNQRHSWNSFPSELLLMIMQKLSAKDLSSAICVNKYWYCVGIYDKLWKRLFEKNFFWFHKKPKIFDTFYEEFLYFKRDLPKVLRVTVDDYGYNLHLTSFSNSGKYMAVGGDNAHFCIYHTDPLEFLHERCLSESLTWVSIESFYFSPDDTHILINGIRKDNGGEVAVFSIDAVSLEVHFVCRVLSSPSNYHGCWFDNEHILVGEYYEFRFQSPIATSISQLYLCSVPKHKFDFSNFYPLVRFLNKKGRVTKPILTNTVSPRFRRVVQIGHQARVEGKTLSEKLNELDIQTTSEERSSINELREVLDREQQCFRCYLKHQLSDVEYGGSTECHCVCHQVYHKMLIYVTGEFCERLCFKLLDNELVNDALNLKRFKHNDEKETKEEEGAEDRWDYIMKRVDQPDHHIDFGGSVDHISLTPDEKHLMVSLETVSRNSNGEPDGICHELRVIELDKMIVDPFGCRGSLKPIGCGQVSSGNKLTASFSAKELHLWSVHHRGLPLLKISTDEVITSVAVHPTKNYVAVTSGMKLTIYDK